MVNFAEKYNISDKYSRKLITGTIGATMGVTNPSALSFLYGKKSTRLELVRMLENQSLFKKIWYFVCIAFVIAFFFLVPNSYVTCLYFIIYILNVDLVSKGKIIGVYVGIVDCFFNSYLSLEAGLYGEIFKLLAICVPLNVFTIISWTRNARKIKKEQNAKHRRKEKETDADIEIKKLSKKGALLSLLFSVLAIGVSYVILRFVLGQKVSLLINSCTLGIMMVYKTLAALRYIDSWHYGIAQSILSLALWVSAILSGSATILNLPIIVACLASTTNNIYALCLWKGLYRKARLNGGKLLNMRPLKINKIIKLRRRYKNMVWNEKIEKAHQLKI